MIPDHKLDNILARIRDLEARLAANPDRETLVALSRDHAALAPIAARIAALRTHSGELEELRQLASDAQGDREIAALAATEAHALEKKIDTINAQLRLDLLPRDSADGNDVILEIRGGSGGDEAALFCGDLFRMYQRFSELKTWHLEIISVSEGEVGGFKEICASIKGPGSYGELKFESGVHRVQRVPQTESSGRIHTSAASVVVLPEAQNVDIRIDDADLRIDTYRASGAGGQHVNKTDSAVRITHLPTGIVAAVQDDRSQHKNRARAMTILRSKLYDAERSRAEATRTQERRLQIGTGDRSERIRTYNFPQGRVTDHRIGLTLYKLEAVLSGEALPELITALVMAHNARLLAASEDDGEAGGLFPHAAR